MDGATPQPRAPDRGAAALLLASDGEPRACTESYALLFGRLADPSGRDSEGHERSGLAGLLDEQLRAGGVFQQALELDSLAEGRRTFQVTGQPIYDAGEHLSGVLLLFDPPSVSDKTTEIAALLSHEIRTPLTVLHAALQLLARVLPRTPDGAARHYLTEAMAEARQLNVLTAQLQDATRIQAGELHLRCQPLDLNDLVREMGRKAEAMSRGQRITTETPSADVRVNADRQRLEQILMNLLTNALMYAPSAQAVDMRLRQVGQEAIVDVRDYGVGIEAGRLAHVTEPFYQVPRQDRPSRGGLGLSLYLCRELARLHGGRLDIASDAGEGSTFTLRLPLAAEVRTHVREDVRPGRKTVHRH
jgi:signal transduction histidine kinase